MAAVGRVTVDVMELPVGDGVDFQGQHELELVYVLDGAVTVRRDPYTVRRFEAGDAFEMRRGTTHHAKASGASAKLLVVDLKAERDVSLR